MENSLEKYPHHSAARKTITDFPIAHSNETVNDILKRLKKRKFKFEVLDYVYVIDTDEKLVGLVSIKEVLGSPRETKIGKIMQTNLVTISPYGDEEMAADLAVKHHLKAIPVVEKKRLVGIIPSDKILSILNMALRRDILHLAGIHKAHLKYENTLAVPLFFSILHRLPWLVVGLFGITIAAVFISIFEATLEKNLILAFFIPAIVYMSGALGTQHQTLFIRDLAIMGNKINIKAYLAKQMAIGIFLGLIIGLITFLIITLFWKQPFVALIISIAMLVTLVMSSLTALAITWFINKMKFDPALGGGPLATIISDVTSIVVYFAVAFALLSGL